MKLVPDIQCVPLLLTIPAYHKWDSYGVVHKRRHHFFEIFGPLLPSSPLLQFYLISFISKIIFWQTPLPPIDDVFYVRPPI